MHNLMSWTTAGMTLRSGARIPAPAHNPNIPAAVSFNTHPIAMRTRARTGSLDLVEPQRNIRARRHSPQHNPQALRMANQSDPLQEPDIQYDSPQPSEAAPVSMERFATRAKQWVREDAQVTTQLQQRLAECFDPNTGSVKPSLFSDHPWQAGQDLLSAPSAQFLKVFCRQAAQHMDSVSDREGEDSARYNEALRDAVRDSFHQLGRDFSLEEPLSFFVYDTETSRLFGDVVSLGWIRLDIQSPERVEVECGNHLLRPTAMSYGAERIHQLSPQWLQAQHQAGRTVTPEKVALDWLNHVLASKSAIGFNVLYDLNTIKKLFLTLDLNADQVNELFDAIGQHFSMDAQDYLLRIDPVTRHTHGLPFANNQRHREFAEREFPESDVSFMPNRKLVSYAEGFLGMNTDNAHDALFDCGATLASFCQAMALREEVLENEQSFSRQSDQRLTHYNRQINASELLKRKVPMPSGQNNQHNRAQEAWTFRANEKTLPHNPALQSTPFIFHPTGMTVHRRHIIPKSAIASAILSQQHNPENQTQLIKDALNNPQFEPSAQQRLSPVALVICRLAKEIYGHHRQETRQEISEAIKAFIAHIDQARHAGLAIRYYEREPAKQLLDALPSVDTVCDAFDFADEQDAQIEDVLKFILYSFYHSLEFNQFIGPGADNMLAGKFFHLLEQQEATVTSAIEAADHSDAVDEAVTQWLLLLARSLSFDVSAPGDDEVEQALSQAVEFEFDREPAPLKSVSQDQMLYFIEQQSALYQLLEAFIDWDIPAQGPALPHLAIAEQTRDSLVQKASLLNTVVQHRESNNKNTYSDRAWLNTFIDQVFTLASQSDRRDIERAVRSLYEAIPELLDALQQSTLYEGDKQRLSEFIHLLFGEPSVKFQLDTHEHADEAQSLNLHKRSAISFVKSLHDSTAYDLPISVASGLQNHLLLPVFKSVASGEAIELDEAKAFLSELLNADTVIGEALNVTRTIDDEKPLHGSYMPYLYPAEF